VSGIIYKYINKINGKAYIGRTLEERRRKAHHKSLALNRSDSMPFHRAIRKYGWDSFEYEVLYKNVPEDLLNIAEMYAIYVHDTFGSCGYNTNEGGGGQQGFSYSKDTKRKISENRKGKCMGESNPCYRIGASEYCRMRVSQALKGKTLTEEHKRKISEKHRDPRPYRGRSISVYKDGGFVGWWDRQSECAKSLGLLPGSISNCLKGRCKTYRGYTFEYSIDPTLKS
jgi:group I intron endonuclease